MTRDWVIRKAGYFYRPNRSGYTAEISAAGRYTEAEAKAEASIEPWSMSAHPASEFASSDPRDAEIASLRAQLDAAKCKIEELGTHCALHESLAHGYTDEIAELQCRVDEARRKAIEDAAKTAEAFAKNHGVQWGDRKRFELHDIQRAVNGACGLIAEDIRALLSESKT